MGKRITDSKAFNIVLAILIAIGLWFYVTVEVNSTTSATIYNVPVTIVNEDVLTSRGLMIAPSSELAVDLKVYGNRNAISRIKSDKDSITVSVDVADVQSAGEKEFQCKVTVPYTATGGSVAVQDQESYTVQLLIERMMNKQVEVRGNFTGTVAEGFRVGDFIITPSTVEIKGPEERIKNVDHAQVTVSRQDLSETYTGELSITFIDAEGSEVDGSDIVTDA